VRRDASTKETFAGKDLIRFRRFALPMRNHVANESRQCIHIDVLDPHFGQMRGGVEKVIGIGTAPAMRMGNDPRLLIQRKAARILVMIAPDDISDRLDPARS